MIIISSRIRKPSWLCPVDRSLSVCLSVRPEGSYHIRSLPSRIDVDIESAALPPSLGIGNQANFLDLTLHLVIHASTVHARNDGRRVAGRALPIGAWNSTFSTRIAGMIGVAGAGYLYCARK